MSKIHKGSLLATTVMAGLAFVSPAYAQTTGVADQPQETPVTSQADPDEGAGTEAIIVTGSRIQRRDLTSTSPLTVIQDEEFKLSGAVNVEQVINTLPSVVPGATAFSNNPGGGVSTLNLRGLGTARTLVLVNGRRYLSYDASQIVDLNTIPQFMLDSVDVVTGGASAVYGSDALAGVVNFRLKQNFEGVEFGGQSSITSRGDGHRYQLHMALGSSFADGRGNVTAFAEYYNRGSIFQGDRGFSRSALGDADTNGDGITDALNPGGSATTPQGRVSVAGTSIIGRDPDGTGPLTAPTATRGAGNFTTGPKGVLFGANFGSPGVTDVFDFPGDLFNYAPSNYLMVPQERYLAGAYGNFEINDSITAFMEATFINNRVANELAATPVTGTFNVNLANARSFLSAPDFAALQQIDANETAINTARLAAGLPLLFGPAGPGATGLNAQNAGIVQRGINRRIVETGSRNALDERNAFRVLAGVKGPLFGDFNYEAYYSYARTRNAQVQSGNISRSAYRAAVENGTINVFGAGTLSKADVDGISILAQNGEISVLQVASASVAGSLGNLGWGGENIGLALGTEYRKMRAQFIPDTALSSGDVVGFNAGDPTEGSYNVKEVFGELRVPIIADAPFAHRLEFNGAARYSDYSLKAVGGVFTWAAGAEYAPVRDLTLRAQYQRAVRAPNVGELFGGQSNGFPGVTDPCSSRNAAGNRTPELAALCIATGVPGGSVFGGIQPNTQAEAIFGGNPDLEQETSDTFTAGAVLRPSFIPRLNIAVDYFNIRVNNYISTLGGGLGGTLDLCYNTIRDASSIYCQAITGGRDPATGIIGEPNPPLILNANVAKLATRGIDGQIDYNMPLNFGLLAPTSRLSLFFLGTYTLDNKFFAVQELDEFTQCAGKFGQNVCGQPQAKFKSSARASLIDGPLTTSLRWRHLGKVRDDDDGTNYVVEKVDAYNLFDLTFGFDVNENFNLSLGVNNMFDKKPQLIGSNQEQGNTYPSTYDVLGRDFFASVNLKF